VNRGQTISLGFPPFTRAVKWLIILNSAIFLLMALLQATAPEAARIIALSSGLIPIRVVHGWIWQMISYSFIHLGLFHLIFNMLTLWMFGATFESEWGRRPFLEFYFFCVVGAALVTVGLSYTEVLGLSPYTATVGASGGIYGLLLAFGMIYGEREMILFPLPFFIKAKYVVAGLIFIAIYGALQGGGGIANVAHLGGLLFGYLYLKALPRQGIGYALWERYFGWRNAYYRWKRHRAARKFEVYMRRQGADAYFDEHGNYREPGTKNDKGDDKRPWVN